MALTNMCHTEGGSIFRDVDPHLQNMDPNLEIWIHIRVTSHLAVRTLMPRRPCGGGLSGGSRTLPGPGKKTENHTFCRAQLNGRVWFSGRLSDPSDLF